MNHTLKPIIAATATAIVLAWSTATFADVVETKDGAKLVGKINKIDAGVIELATTYAGTLKIDQSTVIGFSTDGPLNVAFKGGNTLVGKVDNVNGSLKVAVTDGSFSSTPDRVDEAWLPGATNPAVVKLQRHWTYEVAADLVGNNGNSKAISTGVSAVATLITPQDALKFYGEHSYQKTNGSVAADEAKGGVDFTSHFTERMSWYVRSEIGRDKIKNLELYNTDAAGIGDDFIKTTKETLTGRIGLAYRYESYYPLPDPVTGIRTSRNISSPGLDTGLNYTLVVPIGKLSSQITYVPAFDDFANYRVQHQTTFEMPLATSEFWKIRFGISNDYNSKPSRGLKRLDTTYFTHLVLAWR